MRDPHVKTLRYKLQTNESVTYQNCESIKHDAGDYLLILNDGILICDFKKHFASAEAAREAIEPLLKAWEIDVALRYGVGELKFTYLDADLIDRNPLPPGSVHIATASISCSAVICTVQAHVTRTKYPEPPKDFIVTPDVEKLWHRYEMYLNGREQLLSMAYFCLSYLENLAGGHRYSIPAMFYIDIQVLNKLGDLTSARGDEETARKGKGHYFLPLTQPERIWVEKCVERLIRRIGEYSYNPNSLSPISMSDLPDL